MTREESIEFYRRHSRRLYNLSYRIVRDSSVAEEVMQDTILKYILHPIALDEKACAAWLSRTCARASVDALRKLKRDKIFISEYASESTSEEVQPESEDWPEVGAETGLSVEKIRDAIEDLEDPYRLILNLVLLDGLDYDEISGITGIRAGTLRTQYSRARKMLAGKLSGKSEKK